MNNYSNFYGKMRHFLRQQCVKSKKRHDDDDGQDVSEHGRLYIESGANLKITISGQMAKQIYNKLSVLWPTFQIKM